jgi:hypothetical protein
MSTEFVEEDEVSPGVDDVEAACEAPDGLPPWA